MKILTISEVRRNFAKIIDEVIESEVPVAIPRDGGQSVVILSMEDYESMRNRLITLSTAAS